MNSCKGFIVSLRDHSKWRAKKNEHGEGIMLIQTFVLKAINSERKKLTHRMIIDCIAEQTASVTHLQMLCKIGFP